ncbi:MAG: hypothetical protein QXT82_10980 [Candidatus Caldarchaeum sp.]
MSFLLAASSQTPPTFFLTFLGSRWSSQLVYVIELKHGGWRGL